MLDSLNTIARLVSNGRSDAAVFPWWQFRYQHTAAIRSQLSETYAPATANKMLSALRGVLKECWRLGLMSVEEYQRAADVAPVRGKTLPKGRALASDEMGRLFAACEADPRPAGRRDAAMIAILAGSGLRRSEVVHLDLADYMDGEIRIRSGKGHKDRLTYLSERGCEMVDAWIAVRGTDAGPLLLPVSKSGRVLSRRLSSQAVLDILNRRAVRAGVSQFAPHDMRRTFVSGLLDRDVDLHTVAQLAGHSNIATTARYDKRGDKAKRDAVNALDW